MRIKPPPSAQLIRGHPLNYGLLYCWSFREGAGNVLHDSLKKVNLTATGNAAWMVGTEGPAWDGDQVDTSYFTISDPDAPVLSTSRPFTFLGRVRALWAEDIEDHGIMAQFAVAGGDRSFFFGCTSFSTGFGDATSISCGYGGSTKWSVISGLFGTSPSYFADIVVTYNGQGTSTADNFKIYSNGRSQTSISNGGGAQDYSQSRIGTGYTATEVQPWLGQIDDIRLWNRELSEVEIRSLYKDPWQVYQKKQKYYTVVQPVVGGLVAAGTSTNNCVFNPARTGGAVCGGSAAVAGGQQNITATGGVVCSGSSEWERGTLVFTGFEAGANFLGVAAGPRKEFLVIGDAAGGQSANLGPTTSVVRSGNYAFRINKTGVGSSTGSIRFGSSILGNWLERTLYTRFYFRLGALPPSRQIFYTLDLNNGSTTLTLFTMSVDETGTVIFRNENTTTEIGTSAQTLNTTDWYLIEARHFVRDDGGGVETLNVVVKIQGTEEFNDDLSNNVVNYKCHSVTLGVPVDTNTGVAHHYYFDDVLIRKHGWIGSGRCQPAILPSGAGALSQWERGVNNNPPSGTGTFADIDDLPHNNDTDYLATSAIGEVSLFTFDLPDVSATINAVGVLAVAKSTFSTPGFSSLIYYNSQVVDITEGFLTTTSYSSHLAVSDGPNSSAIWTGDTLSNAQIGVEHTINDWPERVTALYLMYDVVDGVVVENTSGGAVTGGSAIVNSNETEAVSGGVVCGGGGPPLIYNEQMTGGVVASRGAMPDPGTLRFTGFETGIVDSGECTLAGSQVTLVNDASIAHGGDWCCQINCTTGQGIQFVAIDDNGIPWLGRTVLYSRFYIRLNEFPLASGLGKEFFYTIASSVTGGTARFQLLLDSNGNICFRESTGTTQEPGINTLSLNRWYRIECRHVIIGSQQSIQVLVDGNLTIDYTSAVDYTSYSFNRISLGREANHNDNKLNIYLDDFIVQQAGWIGPGRCLLRPVSADLTPIEQSGGWTVGSGSSPKYSYVDEVPHDGDSTYLVGDGLGEITLLNSDVLNVSRTVINAVKVLAVARATGGSPSLKLLLGPTNISQCATGTHFLTLTTYRGYEKLSAGFYGNHGWTEQELQDAAIGIEYNSAADSIRVTALYILWDENPGDEVFGTGGVLVGGTAQSGLNIIETPTGGVVCGGHSGEIFNGLEGGGVVCGGHAAEEIIEGPSGGIKAGGTAEWDRGTIGFSGFEASAHAIPAGGGAVYHYEYYSNPPGTSTGVSIVTDITGVVRTGNYACKLTGNGFILFPTPQIDLIEQTQADPFFDTAYTRFYIYFDSLPAVSQNFYSVLNSIGQYFIAFKISSSGVVILNGGGVGLEGASNLATDTWHLMEVRHVKRDSTFVDVQLKINGITEITATVSILSHVQLWRFVFGASPDVATITIYLDDILVREHGWIGPGFTKIYLPSGAGDESTWAGAHTDVDEVPSDLDTSFISSTNDGERVSFATQNPIVPSYANSVKAISVSRDNTPTTTQGPNNVGTATPVLGSWSGLGNLASSDNVRATCNLTNIAGGAHEAEIRFTNFGFSIPVTAIVTEIKIEIEQSQLSPQSIRDELVYLLPTFTGSFATGLQLPTTDTYKVYNIAPGMPISGYSHDVINSSGFGFGIRYFNNGAANTVRIDHVRITVSYKIPPSVRVFINSGHYDLYLDYNPTFSPITTAINTSYQVGSVISDFNQHHELFTQENLADVEIGVKHQFKGNNPYIRTSSLWLMVDTYGDNFIPTGGVLAGGHAALVYNEIGSGGVVCGGSAAQSYNGMTGGGVVCGGIAKDPTPPTDGGAVCGGSADWDRGTLGMSGFESGVASEEVFGGGIVSTLAHAGNYSYRVQLNNGDTQHKYVEFSHYGTHPFGGPIFSFNPDGVKTTYTRFYLRTNIRPTTSQLVFSEYVWQTSSTPSNFAGVTRLRLRSDGRFDLYNETTLLASGTAVLNVAQWYRVEIRQRVTNSAVEAVVRIDGETDIQYSLAGAFTGWACSHVRLGKDLVSNTTSGIDAYFDDVLIRQHGWPEAGHCLAYQVTDDSDATNIWAPVPITGDKWLRVAEVPPDNDTGYLFTTFGGQDVRCKTEITAEKLIGVINTVKVVVFARLSAAVTPNPATFSVYGFDAAQTAYVGDQQYIGVHSHAIETTYRGYSVILDKPFAIPRHNPPIVHAPGIWTVEKLAEFEPGFNKLSASSTIQHRVTALYTMIDQTGNPVIDVTGTGGVLAGGVALLSVITDQFASGGVLAGGTGAIVAVEYPSGGVLVNGTGTVFITFNQPDSGGVRIGTRGGPRFVNYNPTISGGVLAGGEARVAAGFITSGGVLAGGEAPVTMIDQFIGEGGVLIGGDVTINGIQNISGTGGVLASGESSVSAILGETVSGGVLAGGDVLPSVLAVMPVSGGVLAGGDAVSSITFLPSGGTLVNTTAPSQYILNFERQFTWNIGEGIWEWYRVEGECQQKLCPPLADDGFCEWGSSNIVNVMARSVEEVLRKLVDRGWNWPIKSIKKFTRTVFAGDNPEGSDETCNELLPIAFEDVVLPEDLRLLFVQEDTLVTTSISGEATSDLYNYTGSGNIALSGSATISSSFVDIRFGGTSPIESSNWNMGSSGGIVFGGVSPFESSEHNFVGSGGVEFSGSAAANSTISSSTGGGNMLFGGVADVEMADTENILVPAVVSASVLEIELFTQEDAGTITNEVSLVTVSCCPTPIPRVLQLNQDNLSKANGLSQFLLRNNFVLPNNIKIIYNKKTKVWQGNIYYRGFAYNLPQEQTWNLTFEFGCVTQVGPTDLGNGVWKFGMYIKNKNLTTNQDFDTRFITFFPASTLGDSPIDFRFTLNTKTKIVNPSTIINTMLNDDIRAFQSKYWIANPNLRFSIQDTTNNDQNDTINYPEINLPIGILRPTPVT